MIKSWTVQSAVVGLAVVGLGVVWLVGGAAANAGNAPAISAATVLTLTAAGDEVEYVGSKKCKMCHKEAFESWETTTHAEALTMLKPGERSEAKAKHQLDAEKDYSTDESCLACHATGFGKPGGFAVEADEEKAEKIAKATGHVGCESCHGPGSAYAELHKEIKKSKRMYKWAEMEAAGMHKITEETCTGCHNDKSPTYDESKKFDFEAMKEKGAHKLGELKQREE